MLCANSDTPSAFGDERAFTSALHLAFHSLWTRRVQFSRWIRCGAGRAKDSQGALRKRARTRAGSFGFAQHECAHASSPLAGFTGELGYRRPLVTCALSPRE